MDCHSDEKPEASFALHRLSPNVADLRNIGSRSMADQYNTLLHAVGDPRDHFGFKDPNLPEGPQDGIVNELLT